MIDLNENPNLNDKLGLSNKYKKELERANDYLPSHFSIACYKTVSKHAKFDYLAFPYEEKSERVNWIDSLTPKSNTYYAIRDAFNSDKSRQTLDVYLDKLPNHFKFLDLYFLSDSLVENCFIQLFLSDTENNILFSYQKDFYVASCGANLGTFAKIGDRWKFYPIFKAEILDYSSVLDSRIRGDSIL